MKTFVKIIDKINECVGRSFALLIFPIFLIMLYEVVQRYIFNAPSSWATETTQLLFGMYAVFSGGAVLLWDDHVNVDILYGRLSTRQKAIMDICTSFLFFVFSLALLYTSYKFAYRSISILEHLESTWNPPIYPFKAALTVAAALLFLQGLAKLFRNIDVVRNTKNNE